MSVCAAAHHELFGCANSELQVIFVAQQDKDLNWVWYEVENSEYEL